MPYFPPVESRVHALTAGEAPLDASPHDAVLHLRRFFDDVRYEYVCMQHVPGADQFLFSAFRQLQQAFAGLNPMFRLLLTLFRQGHRADERQVRLLFGTETTDALLATGLLVKRPFDQVQTPGLLVVAHQGLLLAVSVPPYYPTSVNKKQAVYVGPDSLWLVRAVGRRLEGKSVLDICSGSGIQGLTCLARGAKHVVALERHPTAQNVSRFNGALNGLSHAFEVRSSDLLSALAPEESFDLVVCNPPFMPVVQNAGYPICGDGGDDGTYLMRKILAGLPACLKPGGDLLMVSNNIGGSRNVNFHAVLKELADINGWTVTALVHHKHPIAEYVKNQLPEMLKNTSPELTSAEISLAVRDWQDGLKRQDIAAEFMYSQLTHVHLPSSKTAPAFRVRPTYDPRNTDQVTERVNSGYR